MINDNACFLTSLEKHGSFDDRDTIKAAEEMNSPVTVKVKIVGEDETYRDAFQVTLVKIGMQWKVLTNDRL